MRDTERREAIEFLRRAVPRIRARAAAVGTQHSGWDFIGSIEHWTEGREAYGYSGDDGLRDLVAYVNRVYPEKSNA